MPETESRATVLNDHIDATAAALLEAIERVSALLSDPAIPSATKRAIYASFADCRASLRLVAIDGQHVSAATAMLKALAHTFELTPWVARRLRESEADLRALEPLPSLRHIDALFPDLAA